MKQKRHENGYRINRIKGDFYNRRTQYGEWTINGKTLWVQGELAYNEENDTFEHYYEGERGGQYLVIFD